MNHNNSILVELSKEALTEVQGGNLLIDAYNGYQAIRTYLQPFGIDLPDFSEE